MSAYPLKHTKNKSAYLDSTHHWLEKKKKKKIVNAEAVLAGDSLKKKKKAQIRHYDLGQMVNSLITYVWPNCCDCGLQVNRAQFTQMHTNIL